MEALKKGTAKCLLTMCIGPLLLCGPSQAQESSSEAAQSLEEQKVLETIVVEAPIESRTISSPDDPTSNTEIIELSRQVDFSDLDLSKQSDVNELRARIAGIAADSCSRLSNMYPLLFSRHAEMARCTEQAIASAAEQVEEAIAEAD